jgi:glycosyltransferase involved in cell wall biosynthesis
VTVSKDIKETLENNYGFRKGNISVIHNGIEVQKMQRMKNNGGTFVIGSAGRLSPVKDYPFMIEISKEVRKITNQIRFQLAGSGPEWPKLHGMIDRYSLSDVFELKGHVDNIADFYRELELYINTSVHEGIPMSILEAMVQGIPIVAPRVGGLAEIIDDGVQGYLLDSRDPKIFAERCFELYENKSLRKNMGRAAREKIIQAFSVENMAKQYCAMYYTKIH